MKRAQKACYVHAIMVVFCNSINWHSARGDFAYIAWQNGLLKHEQGFSIDSNLMDSKSVAGADPGRALCRCASEPAQGRSTESSSGRWCQGGGGCLGDNDRVAFSLF